MSKEYNDRWSKPLREEYRTQHEIGAVNCGCRWHPSCVAEVGAK